MNGSETDRADAEERSWLWRRRSLLLSLVLVCVLVGGTWALALAFVSPQQIQAAATPPKPEPIVAEVVRGDLDDVRLVAAVIDYLGERSSVLSPQEGATRTVVTAVNVGAGDVLKAAAQVLSLNDQPVFVIDSSFSFYRDLGPGDSGADVHALQRTLITAGLLDQDDGIYGPKTSQGVAALYAKAGSTPPTRPLSVEPVKTEPSPGDQASEEPPGDKLEAYFPLSAALTVDALPAIAQTVPTVGQLVDATTTVVVSDATIVARGAAPAGTDLAQLDGAAVTGKIDGGGEFIGTLSSSRSEISKDQQKGDEPEESESQQQQQQPSELEVVAVPSESTPLAVETVGRSVVLSVPLSQIAVGELLVPSSAVAEDGLGTGAVLVQQADKSYVRIKVDIVGTLGGTVAVRAAKGDLAEGDKVRVG